MSRADRIELALIAAVSLAAALAGGLLPARLEWGEVALVASAALLTQGLVRDLWIKYGRNRDGEACTVADGKGGACMCVESTLGITGVAGGAIALLSGAKGALIVQWYFWPALIITVGLLGFLMKSLVIDWKRKTIRLVKDHRAIKF